MNWWDFQADRMKRSGAWVVRLRHVVAYLCHEIWVVAGENLSYFQGRLRRCARTLGSCEGNEASGGGSRDSWGTPVGTSRTMRGRVEAKCWALESKRPGFES